MNQSKKAIVLGLATLLTTTLGACAGETYQTVTGDYMTGKSAKYEYNAYISQTPTTLSSLVSQSATDVQHIANFSDTLLMNDSYGILRKSLATEAIRNSNNTEFKFKVRDDVAWRTKDGSIYRARTGRDGYTDQYVSEEDFVTAARQILTYSNSSEIYYMYTLFIRGAWEYYCYTMMSTYIANSQTVNVGGETIVFSTLKNNTAEQARVLALLIEEYSGSEPEQTISASDMTAISRFERVGVEVDDEGYLVYTLFQSAAYFPTVLTYAPYMPVNSYFYESETAERYGTSEDDILYIGPYFLTDMGTNGMTYTKNPYYHDAANVHIDTIYYRVADDGTSYADMRDAFNNGEVDGFTLNEQDSIGWAEYITGPDGTGTIQNPYSGVVNSREIDSIDYTFHFVLNVNRSTDVTSQTETSAWTNMNDTQKQNDIINTNKALKISEVRKAILNGVDVDLFNTRNNVTDDNQYQINTYTPKGFVVDENGKDYTEYYYEEYAEQKGISQEETIAAIGPQTVSTVKTSSTGETYGVDWDDDTDEANALFETARQAIQAAANSEDTSIKVSLPVTISYLSTSGYYSQNLEYERATIQSLGERLNGCTINSAKAQSGLMDYCEGGKYPYFNVVENAPNNQNTFSSIAEAGYYTIYTGWGWIGDYADPLTYLHTYVTNGEMSDMCGNNDYELPNYHYSTETGLVRDEKYMFEEYNDMVNAANEITSPNSDRYEAFAAAEYYLINELNIMKPSQMQAQGWSASVSRAAGYEMPTSTYGLAGNIIKGMWVLAEVPTAEERRTCRDLQDQREEEALEAVGRDAIGPAFDDFQA